MDYKRAISDNLSTDLYRLVEPKLAEAPRSVPELERWVRSYAAHIEAAAASNNFPDMDLELGRACGAACLALLEAAGPRPDDDALRVLNAACRYFAASNDDEDDLESLVGFDDDAMVINACARVLGHEDVVIPLTPR